MALAATRSGAATAWAIAWRAAACSAALLGVAAAVQREYVASALILAVLAIALAADVWRVATAGERLLLQFVEGVAAGGGERIGTAGGSRQATEAANRVLTNLGENRAEREAQLDQSRALLDNVATALLVVDDRGVATTVNRAASRMLRAHPGPLRAIRGLSPAIADAVLGGPDRREIVELADGRRALMQLGTFASGGREFRIVSLQNLATDLASVEQEAWKDLVAVMAHEIMNSLTAINSLAETSAARLAEATHRPDLIEAIGAIQRRSDGLIRFVERYREFAQVPAPAKITFGAFDLCRQLELLAGGLRADGVAFEVDVRPANLQCFGDPDLLEQALINLIKNAFEAVEGGVAPAVRVSCELEDRSISFSVLDNGPGVAAADQRDMFVPFYSTKQGGSGVGLAIARQIALAHGGRLEHAAGSPRGAMFRLSIPAA